MKRNRPNPKRERRRRSLNDVQPTRRALLSEWDGKRGEGIETPKRGEIVGPVEQGRRRRREARSEVPAEIREIADEMDVVLPGEEA